MRYRIRTALLMALAGMLLAAADTPSAQQAPVELVPQLGHGVDVRDLAFSRDGKLAASVDQAGALKVWQLEGGFELRTAFVTSERSSVMGFSADGRTVYVVGSDGLASVDIATGKTAVRRNLRIDLLMPDGRTYIQSERRKGVVVGDLESGKEESIAGIPDDALVNEAAASARSGLAVLHVSRAREILVIDVAARTIRARFPIGSDDVRRLAMSDDGRHVAVIEDHALRPIRLAVFSVNDGRQTVSYGAPGTARLYAAAFLPASSQLAVGGSLDLGGIRMFDAASGAEIAPLPWPREAVGFLAVDPVGGKLAIVSNTGIEVRPAAAPASSERSLGATGNRSSLMRSWRGRYYAVLDRPAHRLTVYSSESHDPVFETPVEQFSPCTFLGDRAIVYHRDRALWLRPLPAGSERRLFDIPYSSLNNLIGAGEAAVMAYSGSFDRLLHVVRLGDDLQSVTRSSHNVEGLTDQGVVLSPDGGLMLVHALGDETVTLRETASGKVVFKLAERVGLAFRTVRFSRDGRALMLRDDSHVRVWRGPPWSLVYNRKSARSITDVDFSDDGTRARAVGRDGVFDMALAAPYAETSIASLRGRSLVSLPGAGGGVVVGEQGGRSVFGTSTVPGRTFELRGNASDVQRIVIAGDGVHVATRENDRLHNQPLARVWDSMRGSVVCDLGNAGVLGSYPGGWIVATEGEVRLLGLSDCAVEARLHVGPAALGGLIDAVALPQGEVLGITFDGHVLLLDVRRGLRVADHRLPSGNSRPALVYQLNAVAYFDAQQKALRVVEPRGLVELARLDLADELPSSISGVPGTSLLVVATSTPQGGRVRVWDLGEKRVVREVNTGHLMVSSATVDPAQGLLLVGFQRGVLGWVSLVSGKPEHAAVAHYGAVTTIRSLADGRVFTSGEDGAIRLWRGRTAVADAAMINFSSGDWVAATAEGYFNASRGGADGIVFRRDLDVLPLNQFYDVFYRPDIVEAKLRGEDVQGLVRVSVADALANPPPQVVVEADSGASTAERTVLRYRVRSSGGGIGDVRVYHNGKLLISDGVEPGAARKPVNSLASVTPEVVTRSLRGLTMASDAPATIRTIAKPDFVEGRIEVDNVPGENEIAVAAFNRTNTVQSSLASYTYSSGRAVDPPRLYLVTIGINDYAERPLRYAVKDATDVARALRTATAGIYSADRIEVIELHDGKAGRAAILATLDGLTKRVRPWDAVILFVASHGLMHEGQYVMVTHDFQRKSPDQWFVSTGELMELSKRIRALRQVFVFDTCHAGGLNNMVTGLYDARMTVMARNMGLHLLTAASKSQEAVDGYQGNGLFTHALLAALADPATDLNLDSNVSVMELGSVSRRRAIEIARRIRYTQTPLAIHFGRDQTLYQVKK